MSPSLTHSYTTVIKLVALRADRLYLYSDSTGKRLIGNSYVHNLPVGYWRSGLGVYIDF